MTAPNNLPDLAAIGRRAEAATPGPWKATNSVEWDFFAIYPDTGRAEFPIAKFADYIKPEIVQANTDFIAHAREDIPALLSHITDLTQRLAKAEAERDVQCALAFTTMPDGANVLWSELYQAEKARADHAGNRAAAAEAVLAKCREERGAFEQGVKEAKRQIISTVEHATDLLAGCGCQCDPAEKTYGPIIARVDAAIAARALTKGNPDADR